MGAGRPRKANALHIAQGTGRADRSTNKLFTTPKKFEVTPKQVDYRSFDKSKFYRGITRWIESISGKCSVDSVSLSLLADILEVYSIAQIDIEDNGLFKDQYDRRGNIIGKTESPAFRVRQQASKELIQLCKEFGMFPLARDKFSKNETSENNTMAMLIAMADKF